MTRQITNSMVEKLMTALKPYQPDRVYLFGSAARGEADDTSDLDVVVIKRTSVSFLDRLQQVARLLPLELGAVDMLIYTPDEFAQMLRDGNAFAEMIAEEGVLVYVRPTEGDAQGEKDIVAEDEKES